jgi:hypothetical protein
MTDMTSDGSHIDASGLRALPREPAAERRGSEQPDTPPDTPPQGAAAPDERSRHERRVARALECTDSTLGVADPFQASLGAMTGNLLLRAAQLDEAIQFKLAGNAPTLEQLLGVASAVELSLKLARQIERQCHLMREHSEKLSP